jgi:hypothetical protein
VNGNRGIARVENSSGENVWHHILSTIKQWSATRFRNNRKGHAFDIWLYIFLKHVIFRQQLHVPAHKSCVLISSPNRTTNQPPRSRWTICSNSIPGTDIPLWTIISQGRGIACEAFSHICCMSCQVRLNRKASKTASQEHYPKLRRQGYLKARCQGYC